MLELLQKTDFSQSRTWHSLKEAVMNTELPSAARKHTHYFTLNTYLVVVVQPDPFQRHNFVGFSVFRLEHCPVRTCEINNVKLNHS